MVKSISLRNSSRCHQLQFNVISLRQPLIYDNLSGKEKIVCHHQRPSPAGLRFVLVKKRPQTNFKTWYLSDAPIDGQPSPQTSIITLSRSYLANMQPGMQFSRKAVFQTEEEQANSRTRVACPSNNYTIILYVSIYSGAPLSRLLTKECLTILTSSGFPRAHTPTNGKHCQCNQLQASGPVSGYRSNHDHYGPP